MSVSDKSIHLESNAGVFHGSSAGFFALCVGVYIYIGASV